MLAHHLQPRTKPTRSAFSLVELLVVMAIIGILASLAFVALGQSGQTAREASTKAAIRLLDSAMQDRIRAFEEITKPLILHDPDSPAKRDSSEFRRQTSAFMIRYNANNPPITSEDAEVLVRKAMFKAIFPQREVDLLGYDGDLDVSVAGSGTWNDDSPLLRRMRDDSMNAWDSSSWKGLDKTARDADLVNPNDDNYAEDNLAESAEMFYLFMTSGDVFGLPPMDIDGLDQNLIGDTDGDGNPEFLDGWGKPLYFYNWPTRLFKADGLIYTASDHANASILVEGMPPSINGIVSPPTSDRLRVTMMFRDPDDNSSRLSKMRDRQSQLRWFGVDYNLNGSAPLERSFGFNFYHDRDSYHVPLIVSSGQDYGLGMNLPNDTTTGFSRLGQVTNANELADNLSNRQKGPR